MFKQDLHKIQDELRVRSEELHSAEQTVKRLVEEKFSLEQNIRRLERKHAEEVTYHFWSCFFVSTHLLDIR